MTDPLLWFQKMSADEKERFEPIMILVQIELPKNDSTAYQQSTFLIADNNMSNFQTNMRSKLLERRTLMHQNCDFIHKHVFRNQCYCISSSLIVKYKYLSLNYCFGLYIFNFIKRVHYFQQITLFNLSKYFYFWFIKLSVYQVSYVAVGSIFATNCHSIYLINRYFDKPKIRVL